MPVVKFSTYEVVLEDFESGRCLLFDPQHNESLRDHLVNALGDRLDIVDKGSAEDLSVDHNLVIIAGFPAPACALFANSLVNRKYPPEKMRLVVTEDVGMGQLLRREPGLCAIVENFRIYIANVEGDWELTKRFVESAQNDSLVFHVSQLATMCNTAAISRGCESYLIGLLHSIDRGGKVMARGTGSESQRFAEMRQVELVEDSEDPVDLAIVHSSHSSIGEESKYARRFLFVLGEGKAPDLPGWNVLKRISEGDAATVLYRETERPKVRTPRYYASICFADPVSNVLLLCEDDGREALGWRNYDDSINVIQLGAFTRDEFRVADDALRKDILDHKVILMSGDVPSNLARIRSRESMDVIHIGFNEDLKRSVMIALCALPQLSKDGKLVIQASAREAMELLLDGWKFRAVSDDLVVFFRT